jgi:hypothetical protein
MQRIDPGIFQVAEGAAEFLSNPITARKRKARSKRLAADKPTILVVDDHKIIADTTAEILNRFGFRAVRTYDSQTALQIAAKLNPDFLLTDVSMPIMNGGGTRPSQSPSSFPQKRSCFFPVRRASQILCAREKKKVMYSTSLPNPSIQRN